MDKNDNDRVQKTFEQYVPNFVCRHIQKLLEQYTSTHGYEVTELDMEPFCTECFGVAVMADVSGYSKLTAKLAEKGDIGARMLLNVMKKYFDQIIHIILSYQGDIVKFVGDAVIFYWKINDDNLDDISEDPARGELVLTACDCCIKLLNQLGRFPIDIPDCEITELKIHLGIGAGKIYDIHVGTKDRWEHFIGGDAMDQISTVLDLAEAGELALSHQAFRHFGNVVDVASITIGGYDKRCVIVKGLENCTRKVPPLSLDQEAAFDIFDSVPNNINIELYKPFINPYALYKLKDDIQNCPAFGIRDDLEHLMSIYDTRQVTTIFIRVSTLKFKTMDSLGVAQDTMLIVQNHVNKYEGCIRQFHCDDKGALLLAFFGLPPFGHTDDAIRGVKAALSISKELANLFPEKNYTFGVTTGVIAIGGVGKSIRTEYAMMGDSINMAARLMCIDKNNKAMKPDGNVFCDEKTFNLSCVECTFKPLGEIKVKGKDHSIPVYKALSIQEKKIEIDNDSKIIGRVKERKIIDGLIEAHLVKQTKIMIFEGEGGQGLSTLVKYTKNKAVQMNCMICSGVSVEMESTTPYYVYRSILSDLFLILEEAKVEKDSKYVIPTENRVSKIIRRSSSTIKAKKMSNNINNSYINGEGELFLKDSTDFSQEMLDNGRGKSTATSKDNSFSFKDQKTQYKKPINVKTDDKDIKTTNDLPITGDKSNVNIHEGNHDFDLKINRITELENRLKICLEKLNENSLIYPVFNVVYPHNFMDNDLTIHIRGQNRHKEFFEVLKRIILNVSSKYPLIFLIQEAQFMDYSSWQLTNKLIMNCPNLMFIIYSRCENTYQENELSIYKNVKVMGQAVVTKVEGLNKSEIESFFIQYWNQNKDNENIVPEITSVSDNIINNVYHRTNGNPLYAKALIRAIRDMMKLNHEAMQQQLKDKDKNKNNEIKVDKDKTNSFKFKVNYNKCLEINDPNYDFDTIIPDHDIQTIITSEFDHLQRNFQVFLKMASVLGQIFLLDDVLFLLPENDMQDHAEIIKFINQYDKYGYLSRIDMEDDEIYYQFKNTIVQKCIYNMTPPDIKKSLHAKVADYYENLLKKNIMNHGRLLISTYQHYADAGCADDTKRLEFLEMVCHFYFEKHFMTEAIQSYEKLLEESKQKNPLKLSRWQRELGEAYLENSIYDKAEKHLLESLKILGQSYPSRRITLFFATKYEIYKSKKLHNFSISKSKTIYECPTDSEDSIVKSQNLSVKDTPRINCFSDEIISNMEMNDSSIHETMSSIPDINMSRDQISNSQNNESSIDGKRQTKSKKGSNNSCNKLSITNNVNLTQNPMIQKGMVASNRSSSIPMYQDDNFNVSSGELRLSTGKDKTRDDLKFNYTSRSESIMDYNNEKEIIEKYEVEDEKNKNRAKILQSIRLTLIPLIKLYMSKCEYNKCRYYVILGQNISELFSKDEYYLKFKTFAGQASIMYSRNIDDIIDYLKEDNELLAKKLDSEYTKQLILSNGQVLFTIGMWDNAIEKYNSILDLSNTYVDSLCFEESYIMKCVIYYFSEKRQSCEKIFHSLYEYGTKSSSWKSSVLGTFLILQNNLSQNATEDHIRHWIILLENIKEKKDIKLKDNTLIGINPCTFALNSYILDSFAKYRIGMEYDILKILMDINKLLNDVNIYTWPIALSMLNFSNFILEAYFKENAFDREEKYYCKKIFKRFKLLIKKMKMVYIAKVISYIMLGTELLIFKSKKAAVKKWKEGVSEFEKNPIAIYVKAILLQKIAQYDDNISNKMTNFNKVNEVVEKLGINNEYI